TRGPLERVEDHEHLRILEHGYKIKAARVESTAVSVDMPEDLEFVRSTMEMDPVYQQYKVGE
ncbi:3-deoxy-manno-octulosonate cytidylyltransferase, partial [bacterium]|nr:3-deoxy-manno-octulosonate cytidylyltransferase [bacterium]